MSKTSQLVTATAPLPGTDARLFARFWEKVRVTDGCWEWEAHKTRLGYGKFRIGRKLLSAHRVAFGIFREPIPCGLDVLHACDNRPCVNPAHLFLGTQLDNVRDMWRKGRGNPARGQKNARATHPETTSRGDQHYSRLYPERLARGERHGSRTRPDRVNRGEHNGNAKTCNSDVVAIRELAASGIEQVTIATMFGLSTATISRIVRRDGWEHVEERQ